ncbi:unnamed protein product [Closterium sp. NIES-64]|nr:unnamed protein product [Closterium sp. NIES-65]CAI5985019.1 unnamed protein product [Closterium sp. NIES-64]
MEPVEDPHKSAPVIRGGSDVRQRLPPVVRRASFPDDLVVAGDPNFTWRGDSGGEAHPRAAYSSLHSVGPADDAQLVPAATASLNLSLGPPRALLPSSRQRARDTFVKSLPAVAMDVADAAATATAHRDDQTGDGNLTVRTFTFPLPADESASPCPGFKRGRGPDQDDDDDDDGDDEVQGRERPSRSSSSPSSAGVARLSPAKFAGQGSGGSGKNSEGSSRGKLSGRRGEPADAALSTEIRRITSGARLAAPSPVPQARADLDRQRLSPESRFPQPVKNAHTTESPPPLTPALPRPVGPHITQRDRVHMSFARGPQAPQFPQPTPPPFLGGSTGVASSAATASSAAAAAPATTVAASGGWSGPDGSSLLMHRRLLPVADAGTGLGARGGDERGPHALGAEEEQREAAADATGGGEHGWQWHTRLRRARTEGRLLGEVSSHNSNTFAAGDERMAGPLGLARLEWQGLLAAGAGGRFGGAEERIAALLRGAGGNATDSGNGGGETGVKRGATFLTPRTESSGPGWQLAQQQQQLQLQQINAAALVSAAAAGIAASTHQRQTAQELAEAQPVAQPSPPLLPRLPAQHPSEGAVLSPHGVPPRRVSSFDFSLMSHKVPPPLPRAASYREPPPGPTAAAAVAEGRAGGAGYGSGAADVGGRRGSETVGGGGASVGRSGRAGGGGGSTTTGVAGAVAGGGSKGRLWCGEEGYKCKDCGMRFTNAQALGGHMTAHTKRRRSNFASYSFSDMGSGGSTAFAMAGPTSIAPPTVPAATPTVPAATPLGLAAPPAAIPSGAPLTHAASAAAAAYLASAGAGAAATGGTVPSTHAHAAASVAEPVLGSLLGLGLGGAGSMGVMRGSGRDAGGHSLQEQRSAAARQQMVGGGRADLGSGIGVGSSRERVGRGFEARGGRGDGGEELEWSAMGMQRQRLVQASESSQPTVQFKSGKHRGARVEASVVPVCQSAWNFTFSSPPALPAVFPSLPCPDPSDMSAPELVSARAWCQLDRSSGGASTPLAAGLSPFAHALAATAVPGADGPLSSAAAAAVANTHWASFNSGLLQKVVETKTLMWKTTTKARFGLT